MLMKSKSDLSKWTDQLIYVSLEYPMLNSLLYSLLNSWMQQWIQQWIQQTMTKGLKNIFCFTWIVTSFDVSCLDFYQNVKKVWFWWPQGQKKAQNCWSFWHWKFSKYFTFWVKNFQTWENHFSRWIRQF